MLLQLENTSEDNLRKLLDYAGKLKLHLRVIGVDKESRFLPGTPLSDSELRSIIESSRQSGTINMKDAHKAIRDNFNAD